jgi:methionyl-tRNA formyltransferase
MGTPEFAIPTLEGLLRAYEVVGVVTQPDRRAGRGRHVTMSPVKELALAEGVPVFQPETFRREEPVTHLRAWAPDLVIVAAYGQILPQAVLDVPPLGLLNVHASLLPRWRGAAPIEGALLAGDDVTGVTIMKLDAGMDTGPILAKRETRIRPNETAGELENRLADLGADLLLEVLPAYIAGELQPQPQPEEGVTLTRPIRKKQARIDWERAAEDLHNHVRAFAPEPGAYTFWDGRRLKIFRTQVVEPAEAPDGEPGTVVMVEDKPAVITGRGCLALLRIQIAGKRPMDASAFVRGRRHFVGATLGSQQPGD